MVEQQFPKGYFGQSATPLLPTKEALDQDLAPFKATLVRFIKDLPPNATLLDAGCGVGKAVKTVLAYRPDVAIVAVDVSDVRRFLPDMVAFHRVSVEGLAERFGEDAFDAVICQHVMEHLLYPIAMMENFKKVLRPKGRIFLETPNWSRALLPFSLTYFWNDYTHIRIFTKETMRRLLSDFEFELTELKTVSSSGVFARGDSPSKVKELYHASDQCGAGFARNVMLKILVRIVNPFLRDILIAIGVNKK